MRTKMKVMAIALVMLMMAVSILPFMEEGSDAAVGDWGSYSYTLTYDSSEMATSSAALSVDGMNPVNAPSYNGTTVSGYGSWTWNTTTGIGPFNSYYAAFDMSQGNKFVAILNPFDLTETIKGESIASELSHYNIMWVLPTVYWSTTSTSITLTNDSTSGGVAYAHTIDGHTYKYIAIGVYEASTTAVNDLTVLTSTSGATPAASQTRATFRTYAHNYTMDSSLNESNTYQAKSMQWNFYQWELYKACVLTMIEDFNSQEKVGNGYTYTPDSQYAKTTGLLNTSGPFSGTRGTISDATSAVAYGSDSVKFFIENAWAGLWDFVDGVVINGQSGFYIDSSSNPTDSTTVGGNVVYVQDALKSANGFANSIMTDDARVWGYPNGSTNGSATTGTADYDWVSSSADRVLLVGGGAWTDPARSPRCGVSAVNAGGALSSADAAIGSRLAFAFDVGATSTVTLTTDQPDYGAVAPAQVLRVPYGTPITVSSNTLSINGTTVTATPRSNNVQYSYAFGGWNVANNTLVIDDMTIKATFTRSTNNYTVNVVSNDNTYGTVSANSIANVPYGSSITVNNNQITVNGTTVTATPAASGQEWTYTFDHWSVATGDTTTDNMTITAYFDREHTEYTVNVQSNNPSYGTVDVNSIPDTPYGSVIHISDNVLTLNGSVVTATPTGSNVYYTYGFNGYTVQDGDIITGNTTITANFVQNIVTYVVLIQPNNPDYGSVDVDQISATYNQVFEVNGNEITVNSVTSTATANQNTAQYTYGFTGWSVNDGQAVTGNMTVYANFTRTVNDYTVTVESNDTDYGTVSPATTTTVPYGTQVQISGNTMVVGATTYTATKHVDDAQYTYGFTGWSVANGYTVTGNVTITASFTQTVNNYTVTVQPNNADYGSVSPATPVTVPYGTTITVADNVLTVGTEPYTATKKADTAQYTYGFTGWSVSNNTDVHGDMTATANFTRVINTYTITWSIDGVTSTETYEYGQTPTHADPVKTNYTFTGWDPAISPVIGDQTYTAVFTPTVYTVTFNGATGTPDVPSATGTVVSAITLPDCTLEDNIFDGWYAQDGQTLTLVGYAGDPYYPTANITLYAQWTQVVTYHFSLIYNANGGDVAPASQFYQTTEATEVTHDFVVSSSEPDRTGYHFKGWATTNDATTPEYVAGDSVTVSVGVPVTLFAVWDEDPNHEAVVDLLSILPYLVIVGLILAIVGAVFTNRRGMIDTETMITICIGSAIAIVVVVFVMIPMFGII